MINDNDSESFEGGKLNINGVYFKQQQQLASQLLPLPLSMMNQ